MDPATRPGFKIEFSSMRTGPEAGSCHATSVQQDVSGTYLITLLPVCWCLSVLKVWLRA